MQSIRQTAAIEGVELFVYKQQRAADFKRAARLRCIVLWLPFCGVPAAVGTYHALVPGHPNWPCGFVLSGAFCFAVIVMEIAFAIYAKRTLALATGFLSFDGDLLKQHDDHGEVVAQIDTKREFENSSWCVGGSWVVNVKQDEHHLSFTSAIDQPAKIWGGILKLDDPAASSS